MTVIKKGKWINKWFVAEFGDVRCCDLVLASGQVLIPSSTDYRHIMRPSGGLSERGPTLVDTFHSALTTLWCSYDKNSSFKNPPYNFMIIPKHILQTIFIFSYTFLYKSKVWWSYKNRNLFLNIHFAVPWS